MSKAIAQTVGGKRFYWLIATLAAFLAIAGVQQFTAGVARANVTGTDFCIDEHVGPNVPECVDDASPFPNPALIGTTRTYKVSILPLSQPTLGNLVVAGTMDDLIISVVGVIGGTNASCTFSNVLNPSSITDDARWSCTWTGPVAIGAQGTVLITTRSAHLDGANFGIGPITLTAQDLGSSQGAQNGTIQTTSWTHLYPVLSATKAQTGAVVAGGNITYVITVTNNSTAGNGGLTPATNVIVTDTFSSSFVAIQSVTPSQGSCSGIGPTFPDTTSPYSLNCNLGTIAAGANATVTVVGTLPTPAAGTSVTINNTATYDSDLSQFNCNILCTPGQGRGTSNTTSLQLAGPAIVLPTLNAGLVHVSPDGTSLQTVRDRDTNLIGYLHTVCLVGGNAEMLTDLAVGGPGGITDTLGVAGRYNWRITSISGTPNVQGAAKLNLTFPQYANATNIPCVRWYSERAGEQDIIVIDGAGNIAADWADGAANGVDVCPSAGAQLPHLCNPPLGAANIIPLVKEWNLLDRTVITRRGVAPLNAAGGTINNLDGTTINVGTRFNPANSTYSAGAVSLSEHVIGTHTTATAVFFGHVVGARVTITASGTCGLVIVNDNPLVAGLQPGGTTIENTVVVLDPTGPVAGRSVTVTTNGGPIWVDVTTDDCRQRVGDFTKVTFLTNYPTIIGSFPPAPITEVVTINWVGPEPGAKQVFLAWAGDRIVLEHDWRIPPGDGAFSTPPGRADSPNGVCAFEGVAVPGRDENLRFFLIKYVKSAGPGTFLPATDLLGALDPVVDVLSPDEVNILVSTNPFQFQAGNPLGGDAGGILNGSTCISRALFESEDEGQVDIEAFQTGFEGIGPQVFDNQTKIAFVVYYMKFEDVKVSLVTAVSKPTHNSSLAGWSDWNPGNPWDASKDVTTADWNVSRDILVRGRVRGWFRSSNPSGRAEDRSDPLNFRPADRWIMPDDWPLLAGGPADPADGSDATGTAESFRPYYDLMIAPNNARGLFLADPTGISFTQVAAVVAVAGFPNSATTFAVSTSVNLAPGACVLVNAQTRAIASIQAINNVSGNAVGVSITLGAALSATPAAGTGVFLCNVVPFEGPYSLLDIPGLFGTNGLLGGAALSNINQIPSQGLIRDTILRDFDVDMWDAPMPPAMVSVKIRGTGFIKQVLKQDVYFVGTANSTAQLYTNPYYFSNIPGHPLIPAIVAGGGYLWDSWGPDSIGPLGQGAYNFWQAVRIGANSANIGDSLTNLQQAELAAIRAAYGDSSIARDLVVYSDNHGEFMVAANGDFRTDLASCAANALGGGRHCKPGDRVGVGSIMATADYPDFRGKHFPVASNTVTVNWLWGGYKDVTVEPGETPFFKYVVFHALDRDVQCYPPFTLVGQVSLHPVLTDLTTLTGVNTDTTFGPRETVDFLIDSGQGIIVMRSGGALNLDGNRQFATGVPTFSLTLNDPALTGIREFPVSALAPAGSTEECQAWIKVSNSLLGILDVLVIAHNDEGDVGFDRIIDLQSTASYTLNFRWSLITWNGANNIPVSDALKGTGANDAGNDIFDQVTAIYGWDAAAQSWLGYFPAGVSVPGANDLVSLKTGQAYWIAIKGPGSVTWTYATNVD